MIKVLEALDQNRGRFAVSLTYRCSGVGGISPADPQPAMLITNAGLGAAHRYRAIEPPGN
ncbi:hypothetical protein [Streptomyces sp. NRRL F-5123]|uniref:hypothetical protein n=1 Tax=Streptomyces sp. NRRL F-5123 TaxID=1463856 RepID=UPI0004E27BB8|nr:hypothetical protein [Streptomyces sp. NRRL F-5123]